MSVVSKGDRPANIVIRRTVMLFAGFMLLVGCSGDGLPTADSSAAVDAGRGCGAKSVQSYVGRQMDAVDRAHLAKVSGAKVVRVIRPGYLYTMDYRPERLNVHLNEQGKITALNCG